MEHTPGPWMDDGNNIGREIMIDGDCVFLTVCEITNPGLYTTSDTILEEEANKNLITAAPDMLEALHSADGALNDHFGITAEDTPGNHIHDQIRSAIAKAEGK